jgi:hypothetical protein
MTPTTEQQPLGRPWRDAASATVTEFPEGDAFYVLTWEDGSTVTITCDSPEQARAELRQLGLIPE